MATKLPPQPLGVPPGSSYWNDWYEKLRSFVDQITTSVDWAIVTNKPNTFAGYGISETSAGLAAVVGDETGTGALVFANTPTLVTPVLGAATGASVTLTGGLTTGNATLHTTTTTLTNGAAAAAGTLLNAPIAGNPTKWVPIDDNGTVRYIPTW
jgi:hypothetical protein